MRAVAKTSNMADIVFTTMVGQNVFSKSSNDTEQFFEEPQSGMVAGFLGNKQSAMFIYDRCGHLIEELDFILAPRLPSDIKHEWNVIGQTHQTCPPCLKPDSTNQQATACPSASVTSQLTTDDEYTEAPPTISSNDDD